MATTTRIERSGPSIRAALAETSPRECAEFEAEFQQALAAAVTSYDLVPLDGVLDRWWGIAVIRAHPLSGDEQAQLARVRAGDLSGLLTRDPAGRWREL